MVNVDKYNLKWNDFEIGLSTGFQDIRKCEQLFDVTLVCENSQIQAHKLVLSACSPVFRNILADYPHPNPLIYLRGISHDNLVATLNFMYSGEVNISQDVLSDFLATAEDFQVKGLCQNTANIKDVHANSTLMSQANTQSKANRKRAHNTSTSNHSGSPQEAKRNKQVVAVPPDSGGSDGGSGHGSLSPNLKAEPSELVEVTEHSDKELDLEMEADEYGAAYSSVADYMDYLTEDDSAHLPNSKGYEGSFKKSGDSSRMSRKHRQKIISFINLHKIKMANCYMCDLCNKQSSDNSNMNKHIEFTHALELQNFLSNTVLS